MHCVLPDILLYEILNYTNLSTLHTLCRSSVQLKNLSESILYEKDKVIFYQLSRNETLPIGRNLNKALHWLLQRCPNITILNINDPHPISRFFRVNCRTFRIIGRHCHHLRELHCVYQAISNDHLLALVEHCDLSRTRVVNLSGSFSHHCKIHSGKVFWLFFFTYLSCVLQLFSWFVACKRVWKWFFEIKGWQTIMMNEKSKMNNP